VFAKLGWRVGGARGGDIALERRIRTPRAGGSLGAPNPGRRGGVARGSGCAHSRNAAVEAPGPGARWGEGEGAPDGSIDTLCIQQDGAWERAVRKICDAWV
jgi:hypothetical protein